MSILLKTILFIGAIGLLTGWSGVFIGIVSSSFIKSRGRRFKGFVLGFLGGLTLGIVSYDLLPEAFESGNIFIAVTGLATGLLLAVLLDGKLSNDNVNNTNKICNSFLKAAVFMAIGVGIHNLPSGVALGSLIYNSPESGFHLIIALILHGIPEGLTLGVLLRECGSGKLKLILIPIMTSIPMGAGAVFGCILRSPVIICLSLSFAGSLILYVTLRETLPAAADIWKGRVTTIGNILGLVLGLIMVTIINKL